MVTTNGAGAESRVRTIAATLRAHAPTGAVAAALAWWATYFAWGSGGREPHVLSVAAALVLVSTLIVRPWRSLSTPTLLLGNGIGLAAVVVVIAAPTGLAGLHEAASYIYLGQLGLLMTAWGTTVSRRSLILVAVMAAAALQFSKGWLAWWGLQDQSKPFQGTFYWHNQAGIFLAAGALLAFTVVMAARSPLSPLAWVTGPLCVAGVVYTTSRGSQLGLALGTVLLLAAAVVVRMRGTHAGRGAPWRLLGVVAVSWAVTNVLTGPPFFTTKVAATASTAARSENFVSNGIQRFEDWRRAVAIFGEWPLTGAGFYSFDSATTMVTTKRDGVSTAFAHNGFLQAAADGGIVLALPLFLAIGVILVAGARAVPQLLRSGDLVRVGALVTFLILLLHSGMDFDWTYPALLSLMALVAVIARPPTRVDPPRRRYATLAFVLLSVALLVVAIVGAWGGGLDLNTPLSGAG